MRITIQTAIFTLKNKNMCAVWHTKRRLNLNFPISFSNQLTFAAAETESQFPPAKVNLPSPIRDRISLGVSFGPFANGVCLQKCQFIYMPIFQILVTDGSHGHQRAKQSRRMSKHKGSMSSVWAAPSTHIYYIL